MRFEREATYLYQAIPKSVRLLMQQRGAFIAGGAVTSVFSSAVINDFDVFFPTSESLNEALKQVSRDDHTIETESALSVRIDEKRVQFIKAVTGAPDAVIGKFDFTICQGAFLPDQSFILGECFLQHLSQRRLVFNLAAEFPICSLYRTRKFIGRGFQFSGIEAIKLGLSIQKLKIDTYADLKKQLLGIDTSFLKELTDSLDSKAQLKYDLNEFQTLFEEQLRSMDAMTGAGEAE